MKKHKNLNLIILLIFLIALIIFPFAFYLIFNKFIKENISIDMGDMLSYYGSVFAIVGSFIAVYIANKIDEKNRKDEEKKKNKEELENRKPLFAIEKIEKKKGYFSVEIKNLTDRIFLDVCLYDEMVAKIWNSKTSRQFKIAFEKTNDEIEKIGGDVINVTEQIIEFDDKGYPKEIFIICADYINKDLWICNFILKRDINKRYYIEDEPEYIGF
jgi:membrane protein implicated in regulation of membrane protease activity